MTCNDAAAHTHVSSVVQANVCPLIRSLKLQRQQRQDRGLHFLFHDPTAC